MKHRLLAPLRRSRLGRWLRTRRHARSDCFVVSYPKCGRTWLGAMMAKAIALHAGVPTPAPLDPADVFARAPTKVPLIVFTHAGAANPPSTKDYVTAKYHGKRVILLVRDPRDVMVSYFFHRVHRDRERHTLGEFLRHPWWGIDRYLDFLEAWYAGRQLLAGFHLIRYEDLHVDPAAALRDALGFAGVAPVADEVIAQAVAFAEFDHLRMLSRTRLRRDSRIAPSRADDPKSFKLRRGAVGAYRQDLTAEDLAFLESRMRARLSPVFGYVPAAG